MQKQILTTSSKVFTRLRKYNLFMGFLHLVQGLIILALTNDTKFSLTTNYLDFSNIEIPEGGGRPENVDFNTIGTPDVWFDVNLGPAVAGFLFLSSLAHFITISPVIWPWFKNNIINKINPIRWFEYALSSSIMIVLVAILSGVFDWWLLFVIFGINASMNLFGYLMEKINQGKDKVSWEAFIFGSFAGAVPWFVIFFYFFNAINSVNADVPDFVKWIVGILFVFFNCFALNMYLQYKKVGPWKNYIFGENVYVFLSLTAKSVLAWFVFSGTLR